MALKSVTNLLNIPIRMQPVKVGQWVRVKRAGVHKGDLAKVLRLLEGSTKALLQMVPRPDYKGDRG